MAFPFLSPRGTAVAALAAVAGWIGVALVGRGSYPRVVQQSIDQATVTRAGITDVYARPVDSSDRVAVVMTTTSSNSGQTAFFDPARLYMIKIDTTGDNIEDLVFEVTFDDGADMSQYYTVRRPGGLPTVSRRLVTTSGVRRGAAVDSIAPYNTLGIAIELPNVLLPVNADAIDHLNVWGTNSPR